MKDLVMFSILKQITFRFAFALILVNTYGQGFSQTYFWANRGKIPLQIDSPE